MKQVGWLVGRALHYHEWFLAYETGSGPPCPDRTFSDLRLLVPPRGHFWADPFPVSTGDGYCLFVEEFVRRTRKGHISVIEMDRDGRTSAPVRILEKEYHLSYPFVFEWQGRHYMVPESRRNRTVDLYECEDFPHRWRPLKTLIDDIGLADATLAEIDGAWWMFAEARTPDAPTLDGLHLYYADSPLGPWTAHAGNPVKPAGQGSRPAGRVFFWDGGVYRPSQTHPEGYRYALAINRIVALTPTAFEETAVAEIYPDWAPGLVGTHTLNHCDGLTVIDGLVRKKRWT